METKRQKYKKGDWFAVPLADGRYAPGVITRMGPKKRVLVGYFFALPFNHPSDMKSVINLRPQDAALIERFGDLGLLRGYWPVLGSSNDWDSGDWPMPTFASEMLGAQELTGSTEWNIVHYDENDPSREIRRERLTQPPSGKYSNAGLLGYKGVEIALLELITNAESVKEPN